MSEFVNFVTDVLGINLLGYQKKTLELYELIPDDVQIIFKRGQTYSRYGYAQLYKALYKQYKETGSFLVPKENDEAYKHEYECVWSDKETRQ